MDTDEHGCHAAAALDRIYRIIQDGFETRTWRMMMDMVVTKKYEAEGDGTCECLIKKIELEDGGEVYVARTKKRNVPSCPYQDESGFKFRFLSKVVNGERTELKFSLSDPATTALCYLIQLHFDEISAEAHQDLHGADGCDRKGDEE